MSKKSKPLKANEIQKNEELEVETVQVETPKPSVEPELETVEVTLLKNGYVQGKLYMAGETVPVTPKYKAKLVKNSPTVYF